jgi:hypothetical protein
MKASRLIRDEADRYCGTPTVTLTHRELDHWATMAENTERSQREAWRSFYIATAIVGLLIAFAVWQRFDLARPAAQPAHTTKAVWI